MCIYIYIYIYLHAVSRRPGFGHSSSRRPRAWCAHYSEGGMIRNTTNNDNNDDNNDNSAAPSNDNDTNTNTYTNRA